MKAFLFAYGTLQPKHAPAEVHEALKALRPVGKGAARGKVFDLGEYPGATFQNDAQGTVKGTVYQLPESPREREQIFLKLDEYEGVCSKQPARSLFVRRQLPVSLKNGRKINCWVYEYNGDEPRWPAIFDGRYIGNRKNRRTSRLRLAGTAAATQ